MRRDLVGQNLGKYRLLRLLGQGGFAEVYLGQHAFLKTEAAIKVLHTRMTEEQVESFLQEAQVIARLTHPHIVRVLDFDIADSGQPFLVMDYCPHGTLRQRHARSGPLPLATVIDYVEQVAAALHYAHEHKLIHRDVKPENMLIGPQNQILLSDFGIAASAHSTSSMSTQIPIGTIPYMAPEQIQAQARPASDQYALGIVVYEWLCGERPFSGSYTEIFAKHLMTPPPPLRTKMPTLPPLVEEVVIKALAKDPHDRFVSVQAFALALRQAAQSSGNVSMYNSTMASSATLLAGKQAPVAIVKQDIITPPASMGMRVTQPPRVGMAKVGEAQTDLPVLPAYPGQPAQPVQPRPSMSDQQPGVGIVGVGEAQTDLPSLPAYPGWSSTAMGSSFRWQTSLDTSQPPIRRTTSSKGIFAIVLAVCVLVGAIWGGTQVYSTIQMHNASSNASAFTIWKDKPCQLVTATEVSAIEGAQLTAKIDTGMEDPTCDYADANADPSIILTLFQPASDSYQDWYSLIAHNSIDLPDQFSGLGERAAWGNHGEYLFVQKKDIVLQITRFGGGTNQPGDIQLQAKMKNIATTALSRI